MVPNMTNLVLKQYSSFNSVHTYIQVCTHVAMELIVKYVVFNFHLDTEGSIVNPVHAL